MHNSIERQLEDVDQIESIKRWKTPTSKHSTIYRQKISDQIELTVGKEVAEIKRRITELFSMISKLKLNIDENSNEINITREKLFHFMRGEKSSIDTQNNLARSIKQGIKQFAKYSTSKNLNSTSFFSRFHSPRDEEKSLL